MSYLHTKYCKCGEPIRIHEIWNGLTYFLESFHEDKTGEHRVTNCPGCGESFMIQGWQKSLMFEDEMNQMIDDIARRGPWDNDASAAELPY